MANYSSAAARVQPEPSAPAGRSEPLARTLIYRGGRMPSAVADPQAANAVARQIVEYVAKLQLQNQLDLMHSQAEVINKALATASVATATEIAVAAQAKAKDSMLKAIQHLQAEEKRIKEMAAAQRSADLVTRTAVIRGASIIVGALTLLCWVGTMLSGTVFVHPLLSTMLFISSIVFYLMSKVDK